ncbi:MAG TPA: hypothetical protein VK929_06560 [Longimicrobiales bacterium]|nr:hypothetical protein [Longimicrobiales bacterium]
MKKLFVLPAAALMFAACADTTGPVMDGGLAFNHGGSHADHSLVTPAAPTAEATGATSIRVTWAATIAELQSECDAKALANTEHTATDCRKAHFELYRNGEQIADVEGSEYEDTDLAPGSYSYTIKKMGQEHTPGSSEAAFTYHSGMSDASNVVVLGGGYSIRVVGGNVSDGEQNANSANFTIEYEFLFNGALVMDCSDMPGVSLDPMATLHQHECDADTGVRTAVFVNPATGSVADYTVTWTFDSQDIGTFEFSTIVNGGGSSTSSQRGGKK